jgi:hypothetical protein
LRRDGKTLFIQKIRLRGIIIPFNGSILPANEWAVSAAGKVSKRRDDGGLLSAELIFS